MLKLDSVYCYLRWTDVFSDSLKKSSIVRIVWYVEEFFWYLKTFQCGFNFLLINIMVKLFFSFVLQYKKTLFICFFPVRWLDRNILIFVFVSDGFLENIIFSVASVSTYIIFFKTTQYIRTKPYTFIRRRIEFDLRSGFNSYRLVFGFFADDKFTWYGCK